MSACFMEKTAPWRKPTSQEHKPQPREGRRRELILTRKENCLWLMSVVCFKNAPENIADKPSRYAGAGNIVRALNAMLRVC